MDKHRRRSLEALVRKFLRGHIDYDEFDYRLVNMLTDEEYINMKKRLPVNYILNAGKTIADAVTELCK